MEKIKIGITQGDINGIGYEVILKALADSHILDVATPIIYGSAKAASYHKKMLDINAYTISVTRSVDDVNVNKISIINTSNEEPKVEMGQLSADAGKSAFDALEAATADLLAGKLDAIVTGPINKKSIQNEKFNFPGHTEYLESKVGEESLMLLASDSLRVALVTNHLQMSKICECITEDRIVDKLRILNKSLKQDFGIIKPRIAVLGLNPHAGDEGLLGAEEREIILPAMEKAMAEGILCVGPHAADGFFGTGNFKNYDAILAMYHDQGLSPFKALAMDRGVNVTAGLSIVRTSPAHGTAYNIAGKGEAEELSMREAIYTACMIVRNRRAYGEIYANPLPYVRPEDRRRSDN